MKTKPPTLQIESVVLIDYKGNELDLSKYRGEINIRPMTLGDLVPGDKVIVEGIEMQYDYMSGQNPVFFHMVENKPYYFINRGWTAATKLSQIQ